MIALIPSSLCTKAAKNFTNHVKYTLRAIISFSDFIAKILESMLTWEDL